MSECQHDQYRKNHCTVPMAYTGMKQNKVAWISKSISKCESCGYEFKEPIIRYMTADEYLWG